jgi:hypothetical protein
MPADIVMGRHYLFVREFDFKKLQKFVSEYCTACKSEDWKEVGAKLGRLGKWEFEDYRPK